MGDFRLRRRYGIDIAEMECQIDRIDRFWVNQQLNIGPHIPMAGFKGSGLGVEQSVEGLTEYTQMQVINIDRR